MKHSFTICSLQRKTDALGNNKCQWRQHDNADSRDVTEIGRQPWLVYGVLTTAQAASQVPAGNISLSLALYLTLYAALLSAYVSVVFYLAKKAVNGGEEPSVDVKGLSHV